MEQDRLAVEGGYDPRELEARVYLTFDLDERALLTGPRDKRSQIHSIPRARR
jgi:hypothetical protein